jgi:hypothetical protein
MYAKGYCPQNMPQPLDAVTIHNSSTPSFVEHFPESFASYAVYGMMDLFAGYDQCPIHLEYRDLTTFNSQMGPYHLTTVPMGYTNVVPIYQADMLFIQQDEISCFIYYSYWSKPLSPGIRTQMVPTRPVRTIWEFTASSGSTYSLSITFCNNCRMLV